MIAKDIPLAAMRGTLLTAAAAIVTGGALVWHANDTQSKALAAKGQAEQMRAEAKATIARNERSDEALRQELSQLERMRERGLLNDSTRTEWSALVADIGKAHRIPALRHEFSRTRDLADDGHADIGIRVSDMRLRSMLLHEGDLLTVLDELRRRAPAQIRVRACHIARLPAPGQEGMPPATLEADCVLEWTTFPLRGKKP